MSGGALMEGYDELDIPKMEFLDAARENEIDRVKDFLRKGIHVDSFDDDHVTALQIAAFFGHAALVSLLIDAGATLNACNQVGMTAFHHACREGNMNVIEILLQRGADIQRATYMGATGLTLATAGGHAEVVKKLVGLRLEVSPREDIGLCPTPLIAAAFRSGPQLCGFLVHKGAPVDEMNENLLGLNALSCAILCNKVTVFFALLDLGADPKKPSLHKQTIYQLANRMNNPPEMKAILANRSNRMGHENRHEPSDIRKLIADDQLSRLGETLYRKDSGTNDGATPIMYAIAVGKSAAVRKLVVELHCPVNTQEKKFGFTALMLAALLRDHEMMGILLVNGANPSVTNSLQQTAYDLYHCSQDEPDYAVRAILHPFRPADVKFNLSSGTKTLSKMLTGGRQMEWINKVSSQLGLTPQKTRELCGAMTMRDILKNRIELNLTEGRNHKKLVRVEEILHRSNFVERLNKETLDTALEQTRLIAQEQQSFLVTTFFDQFNRAVNKKTEVVVDKDRNAPYDDAMHFSQQYGYKEKHRRCGGTMGTTMYHRREGSGESLRNRYSYGTVLMRTTPRMLKKSRESLTPDDRQDSPNRASSSHFQFTPHDTQYIRNDHMMRLRSTSTPQLQIPSMLAPPPSHSRLSYSHSMAEKRRTIHQEMIYAEFRNQGLPQYATLFEREEIDVETFFALHEVDLSKMGVSDPDHRKRILSLLDNFFNQH